MIDGQDLILSVGDLNQFVSFHHVYGERLFHHHMFTCQKCFPGPSEMIGIGRGDNDEIDFRVINDTLSVGYDCRHGITLFDKCDAFGFGGADLGQFISLHHINKGGMKNTAGKSVTDNARANVGRHRLFFEL